MRVAMLVFACGCAPCFAATHALLVGVGQYPRLAADLQLEAPANDVRLMRQVLRQRGLEASQIEVLADGVDDARSPTRAAILASLESLRARVRPGDSVYVHFAGHGSLERVTAQGRSTWHPVFLPRDVSGWDGKSDAAVPNAITDLTLRSELDRMNDAGAFVFAVFDACHSARLVRGGGVPDRSVVRQRYVPPRALGMNDEPPLDIPPAWSSRAAAGLAGADRKRGQAVYFYASQSVELAESLPLSSNGRTEWHGLFSWHIAQALALGQPMSYRQLAQHVLSRYDRLPATTATPLFNGDGLDQWVFGQRATAVRQWPLERTEGQLLVPAGSLSGLAEGALFALVSDPLVTATGDPLRPPQGTLGFATLTTLEVQQSLLQPVAWQQWAAPVPQMLSKGIWARLMINPPSFVLRVHDDRSECRDRCIAGEAVARLRRDGVPAVDVRWVGRDDAADVTLRSTPRGVRVLLPSESAASAETWGYGLADGNSAQAVNDVSENVAAALHRVARTRNLLQLAARLALKPPQADIDLQLNVTRARDPRIATVAVEQMTRVSPGDYVTIQGSNVSADPVDFAAFWLGADLSIKQIYPLDSRDGARLSAGASVRRFRVQIDPGIAGTERILVITMPMARGREASDFRFLEQSPLARIRSGTDPELQALIDACFSDYAARGAVSPALPAERLRMRVYSFDVGSF